VAFFDGIKVAASKGTNVTVVAARYSTDMVRIVLCHIKGRMQPLQCKSNSLSSYSGQNLLLTLDCSNAAEKCK